MMVMNSTSRKPNIGAALRLLGIHQRNFYADRAWLKQKHTLLPLDLCGRQPQTKTVILEEVKDIVVCPFGPSIHVCCPTKRMCVKSILHERCLRNTQCIFLSNIRLVFIVMEMLWLSFIDFGSYVTIFLWLHIALELVTTFVILVATTVRQLFAYGCTLLQTW